MQIICSPLALVEYMHVRLLPPALFTQMTIMAAIRKAPLEHVLARIQPYTNHILLSI